MRPEVLAEHVAKTITGLITPMSARVVALESAGGELTKTIGALAERLAAVESKEPIPGPPGPQGPQGEPGRDGLNGKDGTPGLRYCGVYARGKAYDEGDLVTAGGSAWFCKQTTTAAPGASGDWILMVKHGRDARERPNGHA